MMRLTDSSTLPFFLFLDLAPQLRAQASVLHRRT